VSESTPSLPQPSSATPAVWAAYRAAEAAEITPARLVLAMAGLDRDLGATVSDFSDAATRRITEREYESDESRAARLRSERRYDEALARLAPDAQSDDPEERHAASYAALLTALRRALIARLVAAGVAVAATDGHYCIGCADRLAVLIRSGRVMQSCVSRGRFAPGVPEELARVRAELAAAGVPGL
jgi:hypothetical protein